MMKKEEMLFPHPTIRQMQDELIADIIDTINKKTNLIAHAPTGLGKTAAVLSPSLAYSLKNNLTVFFLTSRHTQHHLAINTLRQIKKIHDLDFIAVDIIGKKWMCPVDNIENLYANEFNEYCKKQREENKCEFYSNTKKKSGRATVLAKKILNDLKELSPSHTEDMIDTCKKEELCPSEMASLLAKDASVIIADYNYIFNPGIRDNFFLKAEKKLENSIIIVDEAHNLPRRVRELLTERLSNFMLHRAVKEAKKFGYEEAAEKLSFILNVLDELADELNKEKEEKIIKKEDFIDKIKESYDYNELTGEFALIGDDIREQQKQSYIGSIAGFLEVWLGQDESYARILSRTETAKAYLTILSYKCLDPSLLTKEVVNNSYAAILMSGTLTPTFMYKDILGAEKTIEKQYSSPFPKKNRLNLIIPETTTKFTRRNENEFNKIADICVNLTDLIPGNCALFFPSYSLRDSVYKYINKNKKEIILEKPKLNKKEKQDLLEKFKSHKDKGAILFGVATGSFGEGIDLPGDLLKAVIVIGLPLEKPTLEIKELIDYYDKKFAKGWDYGYIFPAITKTLQNAGRCIRSETDKGVIVFLDERYSWKNYYKCFPPELDIRITKSYDKMIKEFFDDN